MRFYSEKNNKTPLDNSISIIQVINDTVTPWLDIMSVFANINNHAVMIGSDPDSFLRNNCAIDKDQTDDCFTIHFCLQPDKSLTSSILFCLFGTACFPLSLPVLFDRQHKYTRPQLCSLARGSEINTLAMPVTTQQP